MTVRHAISTVLAGGDPNFEFNRNGIANDNGTIRFVSTAQPDYDCITINPTRIKMGQYMRGESALKNNRGMTLIEVLIAIVITFIVFLGLSGSGLFVLNENIKNSLRDEAVSVAGMEMEQVRNTSFDSLYLAPGTQSVDNVVRQIRGLTVNYGVTRTVTILDLNNLQVSINVTWTRTENNQTKSYNDNIATIVRR